jgi:hypothetical protein
VKHNRHKKDKHKRHEDLSRGSAKYKTCLLHVVLLYCIPTDESCTQLLSSDPMINLNTTVFFFTLLFPVCEESPQLGVSRPYNKNHNEALE